MTLFTTSLPATWLERPTGIWKVMGSTPVESSEISFSEYFDLRTLLHCLENIRLNPPFSNSTSLPHSYFLPSHDFSNHPIFQTKLVSLEVRINFDGMHKEIKLIERVRPLPGNRFNLTNNAGRCKLDV